MNILFRAIITGFGLRVGSELAKQLAERIFAEGESNDAESDDKDKKDAKSEDKREEEAEDEGLPNDAGLIDG